MGDAVVNDLIEAMQIFQNYIAPNASPTHCEHDILLVMVDLFGVSATDIERLDQLGFFESTEYPDCFASYKYGSA